MKQYKQCEITINKTISENKAWTSNNKVNKYSKILRQAFKTHTHNNVSEQNYWICTQMLIKHRNSSSLNYRYSTSGEKREFLLMDKYL